MAIQRTKQTALQGRSILIVEDDCVTAMDLAETLAAAGAQVVGPAGPVEGAFVFDLADELVKRAVPIVFTTGYERKEIPARFHAARHCEKPVGIAAIARTLSDELARHRPSEQQRRMT